MLLIEDREHQKEAFEFITSLFNQNINYFALLMEQGTGKSRIIVNISKYLYNQDLINCVIIISTNASKKQWGMEEFPKHFLNREDFKVIPKLKRPFKIYIWKGGNTKSDRQNFFDIVNKGNKLKVFIFNIEAYTFDSIEPYVKYLMEKFLNKIFVVVDESTKIKNGRRKPKRGKRGGAQRTNRILDFFSHKNFYKSILTGTPTPRSPFDLWSQYEFLKKDFFKMDYFFFTHRYGIQIKRKTNNNKYYNTVLDEKTFYKIKGCLKKESIITPMLLEILSDKFSMSVENIIKINSMTKYYAYKNLKELKNAMSKVTFFKRKEECLDLPPKIYETLHVEMSKEQRRIYNDLKNKLYSEYAGEELTIPNKVTLYLRLQAITGGIFPYVEFDIKENLLGEESFERVPKFKYINPNAKLKVLLDDLEEVPDYSYGIIWTRFRAEIDLIENELLKNNYTCKKFYGGSEDIVIDQFKNGEFQWLIASSQKGAEALNLQIATIQYFYSNRFKSDERLQCEDRSHRYGQENPVLYKDLVCTNTVDERILMVLKRQENLIDYFRRKPTENIFGEINDGE
jgi:SNF2 family DNA or RNA helicase